MPNIIEATENRSISEMEANYLLKYGVIYACPTCDGEAYHVSPDYLWEDIDIVLAQLRASPEESENTNRLVSEQNTILKQLVSEQKIQINLLKEKITILEKINERNEILLSVKDMKWGALEVYLDSLGLGGLLK